MALKREIGLWQGTALNIIDMVGIGPFVTLPLILAAMGGGRALGAWILGAVLAIADGLVTAELSAELPRAGGSYAFLREAYGPGRWGRLVSFLFLFQIIFSAPLSMASGAIGFSRYLHFVFPEIPDRWEAPVASLLCVAVTLLLMRRIGAIGKFSVVLWIGVLATLGIVIGLGLPHLKLAAFRFWEAPVVSAPGISPPAGVLGGLGLALILAVYDYLGYYNVCYLAEEIVEPTKTIPRVIVISILSVAVLYILMNACIVSVLPMAEAMSSKSTVADFVAVLAGRPVARLVTGLILWTAFASVFSLTLGYSRILFAAARDGNFFPVVRAAASDRGLSRRRAPRARRRGRGVLVPGPQGRRLGHRVDPRGHPVHRAGRGGARPPEDAARPRAPVPHVALPAAGARRAPPLGLRPSLARERDSRRRASLVLGAGVVAYLVIARRKAEWPFARPA